MCRLYDLSFASSSTNDQITWERRAVLLLSSLNLVSWNWLHCKLDADTPSYRYIRRRRRCFVRNDDSWRWLKLLLLLLLLTIPMMTTALFLPSKTIDIIEANESFCQCQSKPREIRASQQANKRKCKTKSPRRDRRSRSTFQSDLTWIKNQLGLVWFE